MKPFGCSRSGKNLGSGNVFDTSTPTNNPLKESFHGSFLIPICLHFDLAFDQPSLMNLFVSPTMRLFTTRCAKISVINLNELGGVSFRIPVSFTPPYDHQMVHCDKFRYLKKLKFLGKA